MLGMIGVRPNHPVVGVECLADLPPSPALRWSAFMVGCGGDVALPDVLVWAAELTRLRPMAPITIVGPLAPEESKTVRALVIAGLPIEILSATRAGPRGFVDRRAIDHLRSRSIEAEIVRSWLSECPTPHPELLRILHQAAAAGARGGTAEGMIRSLSADGGNSASTVKRLLKKAGVLPPGALVRDARIRSVELRVNRGVAAEDALLAAEWYSLKDYRRAARRAGLHASALWKSEQGRDQSGP